MSQNVYNSPHRRFYTGQMLSKSQSTSKKPILKTVNSDINNKRTSRRVSFSDNLFLQELKSDGSIRLTTERFKHYNDEENGFQNQGQKVSRRKKRSSSDTSDDKTQDNKSVEESGKQSNHDLKYKWIDDLKIKSLISNRTIRRSSMDQDDKRPKCVEISRMNLIFLDTKHSAHPMMTNISYFFKPCLFSETFNSQVSTILIKKMPPKPLSLRVSIREPFKIVNTFNYDASKLRSIASTINDFDGELDTLFDDLSNSVKSKTKLKEEDNITNYKKSELEEQIEQAKKMMLEKSFFTDFVKDAMLNEDDKIKNYFSQHNRDMITFKTFNKHIKLSLDLESKCEDEYSNIRDMKLVFEFNKPLLKFWSDKFFLFDTERAQHRDFIQILELILTKQFEKMKMDLLTKYSTTEFLVNIEQEVELMLNKISEFAKDVKITTLKFIDSRFKIKDDESFDFFVRLFGIKNKLAIILNIDFNTLTIRPQFDCLLVKMDDLEIKTMLNKQGGELEINEIVIGINRLVRGLRRIFLQQSFKHAVENWDL